MHCPIIWLSDSCVVVESALLFDNAVSRELLYHDAVALELTYLLFLLHGARGGVGGRGGRVVSSCGKIEGSPEIEISERNLGYGCTL